MARIPASRATDGVSKSGCPAEKSTTSLPAALRRIASAITAIVGEGEIAPTRAETWIPESVMSKCGDGQPSVADSGAAGNFSARRSATGSGTRPADVAGKRGDLP